MLALVQLTAAKQLCRIERGKVEKLQEHVGKLKEKVATLESEAAAKSTKQETSQTGQRLLVPRSHLAFIRDLMHCFILYLFLICRTRVSQIAKHFLIKTPN